MITYIKYHMPWKTKLANDVHFLHIVQWVVSVPEDTFPPDELSVSLQYVPDTCLEAEAVAQ